MASTFSTDLKLELMATGENSGTWGDKTNTNLNLVQQAIAGYELVTITANTTLVMTDATISNARNAVLELSGTISSNSTVNVPNIEKTYTVFNNTTGAFTVTLRGASQTTNFITWATTDKGIKQVYMDGINVVDTGANLSVTKITASNLTTNAISILGGVEQKYFDSDNSNFVSLKSNATVASNVSFTLPNTLPSFTNAAMIMTTAGVMSFTPYTFPTSDGSADQVLKTNGAGVVSFSTVSGGAAWQAVKTTNFNVTAKEGYFVNTSSAAITATLPASPTLGDFVTFIDYSGTFDTNNLTIARNGKNIQGDASDLTVSVERAGLTLVFTDNTQGWLLETK